MSIPSSPKHIHTSSGIPFPLSLPSSFVITSLLPHSSRFLVSHLALHPQRQTCDSLHSAAYQKIPSIFSWSYPGPLKLHVVRPLYDCSWREPWPSLSEIYICSPCGVSSSSYNSFIARDLSVLLHSLTSFFACLPVAISAFLPSFLCLRNVPAVTVREELDDMIHIEEIWRLSRWSSIKPL